MLDDFHRCSFRDNIVHTSAFSARGCPYRGFASYSIGICQCDCDISCELRFIEEAELLREIQIDVPFGSGSELFLLEKAHLFRQPDDQRLQMISGCQQGFVFRFADDYGFVLFVYGASSSRIFTFCDNLFYESC